MQTWPRVVFQNKRSAHSKPVSFLLIRILKHSKFMFEGIFPYIPSVLGHVLFFKVCVFLFVRVRI